MAYVSVPTNDDLFHLNGHYFRCVSLFCNCKTGAPMWKIDPIAKVHCHRCGDMHSIEGIADSALRPIRPPPLEDTPPPVELTEPKEVFA